MPCYNCQSPDTAYQFQYQAGKKKHKHHIVVKKQIIDLAICDKCVKEQRKKNSKEVLKRIAMALITLVLLTLFINIIQMENLMGLYPFVILFGFFSILNKINQEPEALARQVVNNKPLSQEYPVFYSPDKLKRLEYAQFLAVDIEYKD